MPNFQVNIIIWQTIVQTTDLQGERSESFARQSKLKEQNERKKDRWQQFFLLNEAKIQNPNQQVAESPSE